MREPCQPEMKAFRCLHCDCALGHTDGLRLQIANALFYVKTTMFCVNCGRMRRWRPVAIAHTESPPHSKLMLESAAVPVV